MDYTDHVTSDSVTEEQAKAAWLTAVYHDLVTCKLKTQLNEVNSTNSDEFFSPSIRAEIPPDLKRKKKGKK